MGIFEPSEMTCKIFVYLWVQGTGIFFFCGVDVKSDHRFIRFSKRLMNHCSTIKRGDLFHGDTESAGWARVAHLCFQKDRRWVDYNGRFCSDATRAFSSGSSLPFWALVRLSCPCPCPLLV